MSKKDESLVKKVQRGVIRVAGAGAAALLGGPTAALTAAGAQILVEVSTDVMERHLSKQERQRLNEGVLAVNVYVQERLSRGAQLRPDWFGPAAEGQGEAQEIAEGVLLKIRDTYQQKKVTRLAYLLANLAFRPDIDAATAHLLLDLTGRLSYRQLWLLHVFHHSEGLGLSTEAPANTEASTSPPRDESLDDDPVLMEAFELNRLHLIQRGDLITMLQPADLDPAKLVLLPIGKLLYELLNLSELDPREFPLALDILRRFEVING